MNDINLEKKAAQLFQRVTAIRHEIEILAQEGASFPAVWRNARRMEACLRMLELNLGPAGEPGPIEQSQGGDG
jgi:hypothetical protein